MANRSDFFAVLYVFEEDGSHKVSMTSSSEEEAFFLASHYDRVRVIQVGVPPFWLRVKKRLRVCTTKKDIQKDDEVASENLAWQKEDLSGTYTSPHRDRPKLSPDVLYNGSGTQKKSWF